MIPIDTINQVITYIITLLAALIFALRILEKRWNRRDACLVVKDAIEVLKETEPVKAIQLQNFLRPFCDKYWKSENKGVRENVKKNTQTK